MAEVDPVAQANANAAMMAKYTEASGIMQVAATKATSETAQAQALHDGITASCMAQANSTKSAGEDIRRITSAS